MAAAGRVAEAFDRAVMPLRCVFCGTRTMPREKAVCDGCRSDLPWLVNARVQLPLPVTVTPLAYEFPVDAALKALKFGRKLFYAPAFGELLCDAMHQLPDDIDALLPVPLHWRRRTWRGFNQAWEICRPIRQQYRLPLLGNVHRVRATRSQSGLDAAQRKRNLQHAFRIRRPIDARHVLIVDDVITTGQTTLRLARLLRENGVERVSALAVARTVQGGAGLNV